jgi:hypothetical protein
VQTLCNEQNKICQSNALPQPIEMSVPLPDSLISRVNR